MRVYVNDEERELHVFDRVTGHDYAKAIVCAQERLDTNEFGAFVFSEEEYAYWVALLARQQESEDILFALKDCVEEQELKDYVYEETKYGTQTKEIIDMEYLCLKDLKEAIDKKDTQWMNENGFIKTIEKW